MEDREIKQFIFVYHVRYTDETFLKRLDEKYGVEMDDDDIEEAKSEMKIGDGTFKLYEDKNMSFIEMKKLMMEAGGNSFEYDYKNDFTTTEMIRDRFVINVKCINEFI